MKKTTEEQSKNKIKQKRLRITKRLVFDIISFLVLITAGTILFNKSFYIENEKIVKYSEKSNLDYKVYLLKNQFYEQEYLGKDMLYVANLIDKVLIDFDYQFESDDTENIDFTYSIIANLSINNQSGNKSYFEKSYTLLNDKKISMMDAASQNIHEQISVDYQYYNSLANNFRSMYGVESESKLTVYMLINKKNGEDSNFNLDSDSIMNVVIPLSERSVDIKLDYKEIDMNSNIVKKRALTINDFIPLIISIILVILSLIMMIKAMRNIKALIKKKSQYNKQIEKILKEYDRLIAETTTLMSFNDKEIIDINKFTELLDIHDNLQIPIMYYEVEKDKLSYFYISHGDVVYLLKITDEEINK